MKAKAKKDELAASLIQNLHSYVDSSKPVKAIATTLDKLAKQLVKQQRQQEKTTSKAASKASHQALTAELMALLVPQLGEALDADSKTAKALAKTVAQLAEQLIRYKRKQQQKAGKAANAVQPEPKLGQPAAARPKSIPTGIRNGRLPSPPKRKPASPSPPITPAVATDPEAEGQ
jgi:ABC-type transporter Mla subunit MlaD